MTGRGRRALLATTVIFLGFGAAVWWQFKTDIAAARGRVAQGSTLIDTPCGLIEYQAAGEGPVLLAVHGSGGGFDQAMAFAPPGHHGYPRGRHVALWLPAHADAARRICRGAGRCVCLPDGQPWHRQGRCHGRVGGALSALQLAIRHPDRVSALILMVPLGYRPPDEARSAEPMSPWLEAAMMRVVGSDFLFWAGLHVARDRMIATVVATPLAVVAAASSAERARIDAMLDGILPVSARAAGLRADTAASKAMTPTDLSLVMVPTLIVSARDDGYGTYASAVYLAGQIAGARFLGFETGGHAWVGHNDAVIEAIAALVLSVTPEEQ